MLCITLPGNKWNARKPSTHTCKHVLLGKGWRETSAVAQDAYSLPGRGIDEETLEIRAVHCRQAIAKQSAERDMISSSIGDPSMLPNLLDQIAPDQMICSVSAPTRACKHALPGNGWGICPGASPVLG